MDDYTRSYILEDDLILQEVLEVIPEALTVDLIILLNQCAVLRVIRIIVFASAGAVVWCCCGARTFSRDRTLCNLSRGLKILYERAKKRSVIA